MPHPTASQAHRRFPPPRGAAGLDVKTVIAAGYTPSSIPRAHIDIQPFGFHADVKTKREQVFQNREAVWRCQHTRTDSDILTILVRKKVEKDADPDPLMEVVEQVAVRCCVQTGEIFVARQRTCPCLIRSNSKGLFYATIVIHLTGQGE